MYLHADDCCGQNKNNAMIQYLVWRTLTKRHSNITLSFLPVGHTKFSPDWCFGLFKRLYRRTKVGSLQSIAQVANDSAECNFSQLVSREDGSTIVSTFDWTDFATRMKKITGIKKYHHFRMTYSSPGKVFMKEQCDRPEVETDLLKEPWEPEVDELPSVVPPHGLSAERQWYMYEQIRPKDTVCPLLPSQVGADEVHHTQRTIELHDQKRPRLCGTCHQPGHDKRTCPNTSTATSYRPTVVFLVAVFFCHHHPSPPPHLTYTFLLHLDTHQSVALQVYSLYLHKLMNITCCVTVRLYGLPFTLSRMFLNKARLSPCLHKTLQCRSCLDQS